MIANVIFSISKVYDIQKFDVLLGQEFSIELLEYNGDASGWFSNFDSVLSINVDSAGKTAKIKATSLGNCLISLFEGNSKVKELQIEVYSSSASKFEIITSSPEFK